MPRRNWNKVFVTGGTSFIGRQVVAALVEANAEVTVLVRPDHEDRLGTLRRHVRIVFGDVWNPASLKGRSRGHGVVVNLVGSIRAQPERGLTFQQLNLASARNAIAMAVSDGVPYFVLLSAASNLTGVPSEYLRTKREAEDYLRNSGLRWTIVRAPLLFDRDQSTATLFSLLSIGGRLPPLSLFFRRRAPLPVDTAARGIARLALQDDLPRDQLIYAGALRRLGRAKRERRRLPRAMPHLRANEPTLDDDAPFGWLPGRTPGDDDE
ncbi:SDR family oxidoreductase [Aggregatilinea lenta]|uniref:SDR family oxidoreductase n=1 Tax=Aggregatilinea lenta TaxID=913108 RepID=UPI000E5BBEBF|nr:NAD(P)H-binding protein [Aggregatilinea lenta]